MSPQELLSGDRLEEVAGRPGRVWPSARDSPERFRRDFPDAARHVIEEADQILDGRLRLFGERHPVGRPDGLLDWDYRPPEEDFALFRNDVKFPWEVARHACLTRLGVAFLLTGDERYAGLAGRLIEDWAARIRVGEGTHYSSALEVGVRLIAWCQGFHLFSRVFGTKTLEVFLRQVAAMALWLDGNLSLDRVVAGNHLLGELAGLIVTDLTFPELGGRSRLARNLPRFATEIERQVTAEGVSREQSATYGRFVADFVTAVLATARAAGTGVPPTLRERGAALAGWLAAITTPDGHLPAIGDVDGGKGADWGEPAPAGDARGIVMTLAVLLDDPAPLAGLAGDRKEGRRFPDGAETVFWWTGEDGLSRLESLLRTAPARPVIRNFREGGQAVVHAAGGDYLFVRSGPFGHGLPKPSAHSHADLMAPVLFLGGQEVLVDPGNYGYTTVGDERDAYRIDLAHSLFQVGSSALAVPGAVFRWNRIPGPGQLDVCEMDETVRVTGRFAPADPGGAKRVACARTLIYNKIQRTVTIEDEWDREVVEPGANVIWRWRLPPGAEAVQEEGAVRIHLRAGPAFLFELQPARSIRVESGWVAPAYARRLPAPVIIVERPAGMERKGFQTAVLKLATNPGENLS